MKASFFPYRLEFKQASGTSRGILKSKETWFIKIEDEHATGFGECGMFRGLSCDDRPDFESKLKWVCHHIDLGLEQLLIELIDFPSIQFGLEMAFLDLLSDSLNLHPVRHLFQ